MKCIYCGEEISGTEQYYLFPKMENGFPEELGREFLVEEEDNLYVKFHKDNGLDKFLGTRGGVRIVKSRSELEQFQMENPGVQIHLQEEEVLIDTPNIKGVTGFRVCPNCRIAVPKEVLSGENCLHIGLLASKGAGKTAFLYSMIAYQFQNIVSKEFRFRLIQQGWLDKGHERFLQNLKEFEDGVILDSTEKGFSYPVAVEVRHMESGKRNILIFYDVAGEILQEDEAVADTRLSYLSELDVLFLLVDPGQLFEVIDSDSNQTDVYTLIEKLENTLKIRRNGVKKDLETCLIVTKADKLKAAFMHPMMWSPRKKNPPGTKIGFDEGYDPDWEGMRKQRLLKCRELEPVVQRLQMEQGMFEPIYRYLISALATDGTYLDQTQKKVRDRSLQPLYLKGPLYETLLRKMEV